MSDLDGRKIRLVVQVQSCNILDYKQNLLHSFHFCFVSVSKPIYTILGLNGFQNYC